MRTLTELQARLQQIEEGAFDDFVEDAGHNIYDALQKQFDEGVSPYGETWKPLSESYKKRTGRADPPLTDTHRMRDNLSVYPDGHNLTIDIPANYASFHQYGEGHAPEREMLPTDEGRRSKAWDEAITKAADESLAKVLKDL